MVTKIETLDYYVNRALRSFQKKGDFNLELPESKHTLVIGSQSGYSTGRIVFRFAGRTFSHAKESLAQYEIDSKSGILEDITIVSASGSRQVVPIAHYALDAGFQVNAILCNPNSELKRKFGDNINEILVTAIDEPPTVNTATYGRMIQGITHEDISEIINAIDLLKEPTGGYGSFSAFTILLTDSMPEIAEMIDWKLRGEIVGRQTGTMATYLTNFMHGAGVVDAQEELYIAVGLIEEEKKVFEQVLQNVPPERKHYVNVPLGFGPLGFLMIGYTIVGQIQKNYPDFQRQINNYEKRIKDWEWSSPIND